MTPPVLKRIDQWRIKNANHGHVIWMVMWSCDLDADNDMSSERAMMLTGTKQLVDLLWPAVGYCLLQKIQNCWLHQLEYSSEWRAGAHLSCKNFLLEEPNFTAVQMYTNACEGKRPHWSTTESKEKGLTLFACFMAQMQTERTFLFYFFQGRKHMSCA